MGRAIKIENKNVQVIFDSTSKSEKNSWIRKYKKMQDLLAKLQPLEDKMIELILDKQKILDEMANMREIMVKECIHPLDNLVVFDTHIECKFCNAQIKVVKKHD